MWFPKAKQLLVALSTIVLGYYTCTELTWTTVYTSHSPDGNYTITVQDDLHIGPDSPIRIRLTHGFRTKTLISRSDCWLSFAHAVWDGPTVGVLVNGRVCGLVKTAYNLQDNVAVPFASIERAMRDSIIKEYSVTESELANCGGDPFLWLSNESSGYNRAAVEFDRRYPNNR